MLRYRVEETDDGLAGRGGRVHDLLVLARLRAVRDRRGRARARPVREAPLLLEPARALRRGDRRPLGPPPRQLPAGVHAPRADQRGDARDPRRGGRSRRTSRRSRAIPRSPPRASRPRRPAWSRPGPANRVPGTVSPLDRSSARVKPRRGPPIQQTYGHRAGAHHVAAPSRRGGRRRGRVARDDGRRGRRGRAADARHAPLLRRGRAHRRAVGAAPRRRGRRGLRRARRAGRARACSATCTTSTTAGTSARARMMLVGWVCGSLTRSLLERVQDLATLNRETIYAFVRAIDARDPYTARHSEKVAAYAVQLARALGQPAVGVRADPSRRPAPRRRQGRPGAQRAPQAGQAERGRVGAGPRPPGALGAHHRRRDALRRVPPGRAPAPRAGRRHGLPGRAGRRRDLRRRAHPRDRRRVRRDDVGPLLPRGAQPPGGGRAAARRRRDAVRRRVRAGVRRARARLGPRRRSCRCSTSPRRRSRWRADARSG